MAKSVNGITTLHELSPQQLIRKARDLLRLKESNQEKIVQLKLENKILKVEVDAKDRAIKSMTREHAKENNEEILGKDACILSMQQIHEKEMSKKRKELNDMAAKMQADKNASNLVSNLACFSIHLFIY